MNKLTKLMLASAMMITSGFAGGETTPGELVVNGTVNQNIDKDINMTIKVADGAAFNNNADLTFVSGGGIEVAPASIMTDAELAAASAEYELGAGTVMMVRYELIYENYYNKKVWGQIAKANVILLVEEVLKTNSVGYCKYGSGFFIADGNTLDAGLSGGDSMVFTVEGVDYEILGLDAQGSCVKGWNLVTDASFADNIRAAAAAKPVDATYTQKVKDKICNGSAGGTFDNTSGTLDLTSATGTAFSGKITKGTVQVSENTTATLTGLILNEATVEYSYNAAATYGAPELDESSYITVSYTAGKTAAAAEDECETKFDSSSSFTFSDKGTGTVSDSRKTFAELLSDTSLNLTTSMIKTEDIATIVKGYDSSTGLDANESINFQFKGDDDLKFATGKTDGSYQVIEFAGANNEFTGEASFDSAITKVVANGANTLPSKLASSMNGITVEVKSGANKISSDEVTVADIVLGADAKLTVESGSVLNIGVVASEKE